MWKVMRGDREVGEAIEAFGAICVTAETAEKAGLSRLSAPRGELGEGPLYGLDELALANKVGKCAVDRPGRTYTLPKVDQ